MFCKFLLLLLVLKASMFHSMEWRENITITVLALILFQFLLDTKVIVLILSIYIVSRLYKKYIKFAFSNLVVGYIMNVPFPETAESPKLQKVPFF